MERPVPKREIVMSKLWKDTDRTQTIQTFSEDARRWIVDEAPAFGKLEPNIVMKMIAKLGEMEFDEDVNTTEHLTLTIEECYDVPDVVRYLLEGYAELGMAK